MRDFNIQAEILCKGAPNRANEDAYYFHDDGSKITALVADGVTERLQSSALRPLLKHMGITSAAYAAWVTRDTVETSHSASSPKESLLSANTILQGNLHAIYGNLNPVSIIEKEPELQKHFADPRSIRLVLPATVASLLYIEDDRLSFAHLGDTAIFIYYHDDHIEEITHKERTPAPEDNPPRGVYHNYVDPDGKTHPSVGVGVINGQDELEAYIQTGQIDSLADVHSVLICSDGLLWPAIRDANPQNKTEHIRYMLNFIDQKGLYSYYMHLRQTEQDDANHQRFPRVKTHDDATGIYLRLS